MSHDCVSHDCESPDGSIYNPLLGLWTDPRPGPASQLLWLAQVERDSAGQLRQRFWAEAMTA